MKKGYKIILKIFIWVIVIFWMTIILVDYGKVKRGSEPIFCIHKEYIEESDEKTYICSGLGYKYYDIKTENYKVKRFIPFWINPENIEGLNEK